jgi:hypothetical protein
VVDIFLSYSAPDQDIASQIARRLEAGAEARVWLEPIALGGSILEDWQAGLGAAGIMLLLSPSAVPPVVDRDAWRPLLEHGAPPVAHVLTQPCAYPRLLERRNFFRWSDSVDTLRAIERWAVALHQQYVPAGFAPARLPFVTGRDVEFDRLWHALVDNAGGCATLMGEPGSGKSALAQEFARQAASHFRDICWITCAETSDASIVGQLAAQLGAADVRDVPQLLKNHRLLAVFDGLCRPLPINLAHGRSSVLATTRDAKMGLGAVIPVEPYWPTAPVTTPGDSDSRKLWQGLAACHQDSLVDLAVAIAGVADAAQAVCELQAIRLVDTVDASRVRLSAASRGAAAVDDWVRMQHARAVHAAIVRKDWRVVSDVLRAVDFALESDWMLAQDLGRRTASYLREQRRNAEAAELLHRVLSAATLRGDDSIRSECEWELSWLEDAPDAVRTPILPRGQLALF